MSADSATVTVDCVCRGDNPICVICEGAGVVVKAACPRCHGSGQEGSVSGKNCLDCRGRRYRDINTATTDGIVTL